jgi:hypothetical protein
MNKGFEHFAGHYRHESIKEFDIWLSGDHVGWFTNHDPPTTCLCILCNNKEHKFPPRPSNTCVTSLNRQQSVWRLWDGIVSFRGQTHVCAPSSRHEQRSQEFKDEY